MSVVTFDVFHHVFWMVFFLFRLYRQTSHHVIQHCLLFVVFLPPLACSAVVIYSNGVISVAPTVAVHVASHVGDRFFVVFVAVVVAVVDVNAPPVPGISFFLVALLVAEVFTMSKKPCLVIRC